MPDSISTTIDSLRALHLALSTLARLNAVAVLATGLLEEKRNHAETSHCYMQMSATLEKFTRDYFKSREISDVRWIKRFKPNDNQILVDGKISSLMLRCKIDELQSDLWATSQRIKENVREQPLLAPVLTVLGPLLSSECGPFISPRDPEYLCDRRYQGVSKVLSGPTEVPLDGSFAPTYTLLRNAAPRFGDSLKEAVPYFWTLAIRESMAADLCALSMIEYDGLPPDFYFDMSKQCWDETRHSQFFFDTAIQMLPDLMASLNDSNPLVQDIRRYQESGTGLPIPRERNLYEAILNASLTERLILLHRDTETPGIVRIREKINSKFCDSRPRLADALAIIMRDEVTHAAFGKKWLEYLLPDKQLRENSVVDTELLRGVYLLISCAVHGSGTLLELMTEYAVGTTAGEPPTTHCVNKLSKFASD